MDILAGEQVKDLQQHLLQEFVGAFLAGTEFPLVRPVGFRQGTGQFRIGGAGLVIMPGHLDFGDDLDVPFGRKGENLRDILFGIVAAVGPRRPFFQEISAHLILFPIPEIGLGPPGGQLCEARVRVDLQPPAWIVHQVEVETVHLEERHHFQLLHHEFLPLEVPAFVQHEAPVAVTRPVQDGAADHGTVQRRQHLQGLPGIEHALRIRRLDLHPFLTDLQPVGRLDLPIGQSPVFHTAPDRAFRDADLRGHPGQFIGSDAPGPDSILHRRRNNVFRLHAACFLLLFRSTTDNGEHHKDSKDSVKLFHSLQAGFWLNEQSKIIIIFPKSLPPLCNLLKF